VSYQKVKIEVFRCVCERCEHEWKSEKLPIRCAKCKSPYWNVPKSNKS
jgi:Zn finger protein HypA/HybF involved in hydrogenase expression